MPKAYIVGHVDIHDMESYKAYMAQVPAVIRAHGGRYLVRGGDPETLEGTAPGPRAVVLEFPDRNAANSFYNSAAYTKIRSIRQAASAGVLVVMDGLDTQPE